MGVCLKIYIDHIRTKDQLWEISEIIPSDEKLNRFLKELEAYENKIGAAPIGGYNRWESEFDDFTEFKELLIEGSAAISNSVFSIHFGQKAVIIDHWTKLGYFCDDHNLQLILKNINYRLTELFHSTTIIYAADSAYKTEYISCMIREGKNIRMILDWIKKENIRISKTINGIKRYTQGSYYETDACYIEECESNIENIKIY